MKQIEPLQSHDPEAQVREDVINRYLAGEKPTSICRELGRSRTWFYKALRRFKEGGRAALRSRSRRPHHMAHQIPISAVCSIWKPICIRLFGKMV